MWPSKSSEDDDDDNEEDEGEEEEEEVSLRRARARASMLGKKARTVQKLDSKLTSSVRRICDEEASRMRLPNTTLMEKRNQQPLGKKDMS